MNTVRATRIARRLAFLAPLVLAALLWAMYGLMRVPAGMDTLPDTHPPGTLCLIAKHPGGVRPGSVVFLDVRGGGTLLARVERLLPGDALEIRLDNRSSPYLYLEEQGPYPLSAVRGLVLTQFLPQAPAETPWRTSPSAR